MEQVVCKGQLCFSTGPETRQSIPDGFLVCTDGICRGAFSIFPSLTLSPRILPAGKEQSPYSRKFFLVSHRKNKFSTEQAKG